jgi:3-dehydroquinate synthase class II
VLVAARTADGQEDSVLLQNAETVKLVGPASLAGEGAGAVHSDCVAGPEVMDEDAPRLKWKTVAVTDVKAGDLLFVKRSVAGAGRHMGTAVQETLHEW